MSVFEKLSAWSTFAAAMVAILAFALTWFSNMRASQVSRSQIIAAVFSNVFTDLFREIRDRILFPPQELASVRIEIYDIEKVFMGYNRMALMISHDKNLKVAFLNFQKDEIEKLFSMHWETIKDKHIDTGGRTNYMSNLLNLRDWGIKYRILDT